METGAGAEVIRALLARRDEISAELFRIITHEIPDLDQDARMTALFEASTAENVSAAMHAVANRASMVSIEAPPAALEYARRLAQRDVSITALLRAYLLGQARFLDLVFQELQAIGGDQAGTAVMEIVAGVATYVGRVAEQVAAEYQAERELWVGGKAALRQHWVSELLYGEAPDLRMAEGALSYRLGGWHLAVEAWIEGPHDSSNIAGAFDRLGQILRSRVGARTDHLMVPTDARDVRYWLPVRKGFEVDPDAFTADLRESKLPVRLAFGEPREGLDGFRSSSFAAARVKALALEAGASAPAVLAFGSVAPMAILADDRAELRAFVTATLKDLAAPDQRCVGLRESLLVFLESNRSYHEAASRLHVHRNTVHYRIQQAIDALGSDLPSDTFAIHLALSICKWYDLSPR
ncbi:PucR family transcriptional regulator [Streptomyces canus]|uniref:PucR family transcriptional regulator n=1 Tax=Streptomyces canus TaxID=58343 RepID=UPI00371CCCEA